MVEFHTSFARYRLRWKPEPLAEEIPVGHRDWRPCVPDFRVVFPADHGSKGLPIGLLPRNVEAFLAGMAELRNELPSEFAAAVERFHGGQWAMLMLMHRCPESLDMARISPVLMYCLANSDQFRGTLPDAAAIQALFRCRQRQRAVLGWLGFPCTESLAKTMRKIVPEAANPSSMRALRAAVLKRPEIGPLLAHVPKVCEGVLALVIYGSLHSVLTPRLLADVAGAEEEQAAAPTADLLTKAMFMLKELAPHREVRPFESRQQVKRFHDAILLESELEAQRRRLALQAAEEERERLRQAQEEARPQRRRARAPEAGPPAPAGRRRRDPRRGDEPDAVLEAAGWRRVDGQRPAHQRPVQQEPIVIPARHAAAMRRFTPDDLRRLQRMPFPRPPFPGNSDIVPITSETELREEGRVQHHCAGTYEGLILANLVYFYRVLNPERATLSLMRCGRGWEVDQLRGWGNADVSRLTTRYVKDWLREEQERGRMGRRGESLG